MSLQTAKGQFINTWGDMASSWGVSRTMAQIYALLYVAPAPLDTEAIMLHLDISRGNANMNLHKLLDWGLIAKITRDDTRRDYFVAEKDVWSLTARIIDERQKREIAPVSHLLEAIAQSVDTDAQGQPRATTPEEQQFQTQVREMSAFLHLFDRFTTHLLPILRNRDFAKLQQILRTIEE